MNKSMLSFSAASILAYATWAVPVIRPQAPVYDKASHLFTLSYELSEPAVVTVRVSTNSVAVPRKGITHLDGDVNRLVTAATGIVRWRPEADFPAGNFDVGQLKLELVAWSRELPPDYMVVDLVAKNCVRYYETADDIPGGVGPGSDDRTRKDAIVMRRIPAKNVRFRMGSLDNGKYLNREANEVCHLETLTNDYYMGVYPVTQAQYAKFKNNTATYKNVSEAPLLPVENVPYKVVRGGESEGIDWPQTGSTVLGTSYLGLLRAWSGVAFDLPTEAQWEYGARAGSATDLVSGEEMVGNGTSIGDDKVNPYGWTKANCQNHYGDLRPGPVGCWLPNAWGLYDLHGSVYELCRDWYVEDRTTLDDLDLDSKGATSGTRRSGKCGCFKWTVVHCRLSRRLGVDPEAWGNDTTGFRLYAPCLAK